MITSCSHPNHFIKPQISHICLCVMGLKDLLKNNPIAKRIAANASKQLTQEHIYLYRAGLLLKCRDVCRSTPSGNPSMVDVDKFTTEVDEMSREKLKTFVQEEVNKQLQIMFASIENSEILRSQAGLNESAATTSSKQAQLYVDELQFAVDSAPSSIAGAGRGVLVNSPSSVPPGTVICLYPGMVSTREDLREEGYYASLMPDPDFMLMARADQTVIDGRSADKMPANPFALGHLVNHCGADRKPNVMQVAYDFPNDWLVSSGFPEHLRRFIPHRFARPLTWMKRMAIGPATLMPSLVLLSTRHVQHGEELLMDYRLNPDAAALPAWYQPFDADAARSRWGELSGDSAPSPAAASPTQPSQ